METRFAHFVFDPEQRVLRSGTELVAIPPKAFQLLELLIANRPNAVAKKDLYDALWPDTIVDEANLKNLVGELRAALGDDAKKPRFIRTASRFGYAFTCDVPGASFVVVHAGTAFPLCDGEHVVGRLPSVSVPIDSPLISRRHARIVIARGQATIEDLGSKNGTFVNGEKIRGLREVRDGDQIALAETIVLRLRVLPATGSTITKP